MSKFLLNRCIRDLSPLTVLKDNLQQTAKPILNYYAKNAASRGIKVLFISYETLEKEAPEGIDCFLYATSWEKVKSLKELYEHISSWRTQGKQHIVMIDTINPILNTSISSFTMFFGSVLALGSICFLTSFHKDVTLENYPSYLPPCEVFLDFTSTCTVSLIGMQHLSVEHDAKMRSLPNPLLEELQDDKIISLLGSNCETAIVLHVEFRKKSGRIIKESCVLKNGKLEPYTPFEETARGPEPADNQIDFNVSFNLNVSEKERKERDKVFLPYFSAQMVGSQHKSSFVDEGTIIYHADEADDFDEEEDADEDLLI
ncbi:hypothetical protein POMI540_3622 [Schizosaccharomyces pombe]|uniref:Elongator complex protein 5 n=1 Tax=Schizosaccharomyces pombe (strain 972 / ATCC 24843) TaxID=284812 RepID=ELP5_SCHPO|nr:putative elongator complex subunit Iki1 [Schizosaccharomyces pombe]O94495.1 RecName: Full=Elongator complex protein 5; AltName: Full=Protein iki1 [Schizosaccharomyces pombe 972h-]CAA22665.1 elongator complex subunit Iki1 (predicted) [Schizosaccharomyces pombe]|eukprot:NP_595851.1 putative elongator complex subunit Iki1 [Schizosaccharomyces pombe]